MMFFYKIPFITFIPVWKSFPHTYVSLWWEFLSAPSAFICGYIPRISQASLLSARPNWLHFITKPGRICAIVT